MKSPIYSSRYFIVIGIFIFLCFAGIWFFMSGKLTKRTEQISVELATKNYELKSNIIRNEFYSFIKGIDNLETLLPEIHSKSDFIKQQKTAAALLLSNHNINKGWYAIVSQTDTLYKSIQKNDTLYTSSTILKHQKEWIRHELMDGDFGEPAVRSGKLIAIADTLHWLVSSKHKISNTEELIFGLDINLKELQHYLWGVDAKGRASAFVIDEKGYYVTNPYEQLIGTKMEEPSKLSADRIRLKDSVSSYEFVISPILELPVIRYYTPLNIASMKWTMVIDTPVLVVDEDAKAIEKYLMAMFVSAAFIILFLIAWAQAKWQREFMLRQQTEMKRQELSMEKQALSLVAERQQKDNALLQLNSLKQKVNPHFLFNSLSSLNALIEKSPELAKSFVIKLSKVYRYVLESYPNGLATVSEELQFVNEYFFLMKIRFGDALEPLGIQISTAHLERSIPFMSLQTLIENVVKHNMLSKEKPLKIKIESIGEHIVVTNNLQLRKDVRDSSKQGLNYLQSTYAYFGSEQFKYGEEDDVYKVYLPVLKSIS